MKECGIDYDNRQEVGKFSEFSALRLSHDIAEVARAVNPDFLLNFKGIIFEKQVDLNYNRHWGGEYAFYYTPPDKVTEKPALTLNGNVAYFSHRIFSGYSDKASVELRTVFSNVLDNFLPAPLLKYENLPSFARAFVTEQPGRRMEHILSYVPELRGPGTEMIEEPIKLHNVNISLRNDGRTPKKVYLASCRTPLQFKRVDDYINVTIPLSKGYSLVVFDE